MVRGLVIVGYSFVIAVFAHFVPVDWKFGFGLLCGFLGLPIQNLLCGIHQDLQRDRALRKDLE